MLLNPLPEAGFFVSGLAYKHINENKQLMVSSVFRVTNKSHLSFLSRVFIKEKGYNLDFNRELINTKIFREGSDLIIKNVPTDVLKEF